MAVFIHVYIYTFFFFLLVVVSLFLCLGKYSIPAIIIRYTVKICLVCNTYRRINKCRTALEGENGEPPMLSERLSRCAIVGDNRERNGFIQPTNEIITILSLQDLNLNRVYLSNSSY